MRVLTVKYEGECAACGKTLEIGQPAMYEKTTGIFCPGCEPKTVEEIREYRTQKAAAKAERYEGWAAKREERATAALNSHPEMRHDWAFITQPGHIPARARMNAADERAYESLDKAKEMREKAAGIMTYKTRVAGDAERKREKLRALMDTVVKKGSRVNDFCFGEGEVVGIYPKSYRIKFDRLDRVIARDKTYIHPLKVSEGGQP